MSEPTPPLPTLLLVDGSSYLYRAYHAMPDLRGPDGLPTGAIHGMVAMMKRLREQVLGSGQGGQGGHAGHAACVFDAHGPTFRDGWYDQYKAQRAPMPDDLRAQIPAIHEVVRLLGWPILEVPGIEADDAIGTLARVGAAAGHQVIVSTGDKDLAQLVTERVTLINTMSNERLDIAGVQAKFGVPPDRIVDYLTLVGDVVDNVPGVDKVGPKTAVKWLAEHGSLDGVIAAAGGIKGAVGDNLRKALDWLPQARRLVTVVTDCDLTAHLAGWPSVEGLAMQPVDEVGLLDFYQRYGFRTWRKELETTLGVPAAPDAPAASRKTSEHGLFDAADAAPGPAADAGLPDNSALAQHYETVLTFAQLETWLARLRAAPLAALDTETDSLDPMRARIVGISFAVQPGEAARSRL